MNTVITANLFDKSVRNVYKDVTEHFHNDALRRRVINLKDGYYLSVLTGSHAWACVEVALMKDGAFVAHPTDPEWGEADDFAIINLYSVEGFGSMLIDIENKYDKMPIDHLWATMHEVY